MPETVCCDLSRRRVGKEANLIREDEASDRLTRPPLPEPLVRDRLIEVPRVEYIQDRLAPDHPGRDAVLAAHATALERGDAGYLDPASGLFVLTAGFLADRGTCCGRGCRHCPYLS